MQNMIEPKIRVAVAGAKGRMGREVVNMVLSSEDMELVSCIDSTLDGVDAGAILGKGALGVPFRNDIDEALTEAKPDVLVDFTIPALARQHTEKALQLGVRPVVGTTGFAPKDIEELDKLALQQGIGAVVAPNFTIGAILMMRFASMAAKYMPHVEIVELHHDRKLDAPSGTAMKTAEAIAAVREEIKQGHPSEKEEMEGARGAYYQGFRVHSVRLPGLFAHQEVLFGAPGQMLTIRHDSFQREAYMPGVQLAVRKVVNLQGLVYGLEHLIED
jgi:4-hydroxy-tetrahydrodipicolinate reductase